MYQRQKIYVRCLFNTHKKLPAILANEPKYLDIKDLISFHRNSSHVQVTILEFNGILYSKEDGYPKPGEDPDLEMDQDRNRERPASTTTHPSHHEGKLTRAYDGAQVLLTFWSRC